MLTLRLTIAALLLFTAPASAQSFKNYIDAEWSANPIVAHRKTRVRTRW